MGNKIIKNKITKDLILLIKSRQVFLLILLLKNIYLLINLMKQQKILVLTIVAQITKEIKDLFPSFKQKHSQIKKKQVIPHKKIKRIIYR